jgi:WS/DGAT/MGAT family acyltransferase
MALMPPTDSIFLIPETREQPMHVGSLQLFRPPEGAGPDFLRDIYRQLLEVTDVAPLFRRRAQRSLRSAAQWTWVEDTDLDLEHHIRHSALPRPGRIRELLALASRLHSTLLDRHRPLWELHLIEGLEDGRFAIYTKQHHAMMDGVSGMRLLERCGSTSPDDTALRAPFMPLDEPPHRRSESGGRGLRALPGMAWGAAGEVASLGPALLRTAERAIREQGAAMPMQAPRTILNGGITGARRFAAQSWPMQRLRAVAEKESETTLNDVVLAMSAGALRAYLLELDALPDESLTAMVPMSLRSMGIDTSAGNAVGTLITTLATDEPDPAARLAAISASMRQGKEGFAGMNRLQVTALSSLALAPLALGSVFGANRLLPPPFNLVISNVPGPKQPLYWNGARLDALYPLSIPTVGQALNITVTSYDDSMEFGIVGCRRSAPHLQRLLTHLDDELDGLTRAVAA